VYEVHKTNSGTELGEFAISQATDGTSNFVAPIEANIVVAFVAVCYVTVFILLLEFVRNAHFDEVASQGIEIIAIVLVVAVIAKSDPQVHDD
jgi:hypothetical protein